MASRALLSILTILIVAASCTMQEEQHAKKAVVDEPFFDSLLLQYTYNPIKRTLTEYDKEWYLMYDSSQSLTGYVNMKGDTVIPLKYYQFGGETDTFRNIAWVSIPRRGIVAINKKEEILFEAYLWDALPDEIHDGLFRIIKNGKIGFANEKGEIVIEPMYDNASWFEDGKATVGFNCLEQGDDEHGPTFLQTECHH